MALESEKKSGLNRGALISRGAAVAILAALVGAGVYAVMIPPRPSLNSILTILVFPAVIVWRMEAKAGKALVE